MICGSMVLAFSEGEKPHLEELYRRGQANGVPGLALLTGDEARALEPNLSDEVVAALPRPQCGHLFPLGVLPGPGGDRGAQRRGASPEHPGHRPEPSGWSWLVTTDKGQMWPGMW